MKKLADEMTFADVTAPATTAELRALLTQEMAQIDDHIRHRLAQCTEAAASDQDICHAVAGEGETYELAGWIARKILRDKLILQAFLSINFTILDEDHYAFLDCLDRNLAHYSAPNSNAADKAA